MNPLLPFFNVLHSYFSYTEQYIFWNNQRTKVEFLFRNCQWCNFFFIRETNVTFSPLFVYLAALIQEEIFQMKG